MGQLLKPYNARVKRYSTVSSKRAFIVGWAPNVGYSTELVAQELTRDPVIAATTLGSRRLASSHPLSSSAPPRFQREGVLSFP